MFLSLLCQVCDRYNTQQGGTAPFFERDLLVRPHSTEHLMVPNRSRTSSPETWSYTDSVPARPQSAVTASAASGAATQAALRRLLGFDDDESQDIMRKVCCYVSHGSISICRHYTNDTHLKRLHSGAHGLQRLCVDCMPLGWYSCNTSSPNCCKASHLAGARVA